MIKKNKKRKQKPNSKVTKIKCFRCNELFKSRRNDAKFCSSLCRVQERNFRIENGLEYLVFSGTGYKLKMFLFKFYELKYNFGFSEDYYEIKGFAEQNDMNKSWKFQSNEYIVYYSPTNKKNPYEVYFSQKKYGKLMSFNKIESISNVLKKFN